MDAKDAVDATPQEQRQVRERAEAAVAQEDVAGDEPGMELRRVGHVVRVERSGEDLQEHPRAGVEHGQEVGDREPAPGLLPAGLPEVGLEFGRVGHGERGAVDDEDATSKPCGGVAGGVVERVGDGADQSAEDPQRQSAASEAVGGVGEDRGGEVGEVLDGGVAVEDLDEDGREGGFGVEEAFTLLMADVAAEGEDGGSVDERGGILLESAEDAKNAVMHQETSCTG